MSRFATIRAALLLVAMFLWCCDPGSIEPTTDSILSGTAAHGESLDITNDGAADLFFESGFDTVGSIASVTLRVFHTRPGTGHRITSGPLSHSALIAADIQPPVEWTTSPCILARSISRTNRYDPNPPVWTGEATDKLSYLGLEVRSGGNTYYGWLAIIVKSTGRWAITDYAVHHQPNTAIRAGEHP